MRRVREFVSILRWAYIRRLPSIPADWMSYVGCRTHFSRTRRGAVAWYIAEAWRQAETNLRERAILTRPVLPRESCCAPSRQSLAAGVALTHGPDCANPRTVGLTVIEGPFHPACIAAVDEGADPCDRCAALGGRYANQ